jgi:hypothetical protein
MVLVCGDYVISTCMQYVKELKAPLVVPALLTRCKPRIIKLVSDCINIALDTGLLSLQVL